MNPATTGASRANCAAGLHTLDCVVDSAIGPLRLTAGSAGLVRCDFAPGRALEAPPRGGGQGGWILREAGRQLGAYLAGRRRTFDLPLALAGTPFQLQVWEALLEIPYGGSASYGQIARRVGRPGAARAVGAACGANPIALIVPCHRVIGADGAPTGFGGGLPLKHKLLQLEKMGRLPA